LPKAVNRNRLNLLHCTANTAPVSCSVPLIVTVHDIIFLESVDFKGTTYQNLGNLYRRFVVPKIVKKADLILTVSEFEKDNILRKLKLPEEKVQVLYNGVGPQFNANYTKEEIELFRTKFQLPSEYIMFLGNTAPKKNTLNVIKAYVHFCQQSENIIPLVLLDYKKENVESILAEMSQPALISNFVFPGYIPHNQIPLMYNAATLFLYPSLRESFGLPILEAMACGVPVITSNTSSMPEIAGDAAHIIDPFNYKDLAKGIDLLVTNAETRNSFRQKGLERVKSFTWRSSAEQLLKFYEKYAS
jgi:glycosyltransferase involved in cell wall biosynthesis